MLLRANEHAHIQCTSTLVVILAIIIICSNAIVWVYNRVLMYECAVSHMYLILFYV